MLILNFYAQSVLGSLRLELVELPDQHMTDETLDKLTQPIATLLLSSLASHVRRLGILSAHSNSYSYVDPVNYNVTVNIFDKLHALPTTMALLHYSSTEVLFGSSGRFIHIVDDQS